MSEVITKRLMTDDTGQEIVDALEDLALAVKPTGAEIDMSSTDTTKVKDAIETNSQAIQTLENYTAITGTTKSAIESALVTFAGGMENGEQRLIRFSNNTASVPMEGTTYIGFIGKQENRLIVQVHGISSIEMDLTGFYINSTWTWQSLNQDSKKKPFCASTQGSEFSIDQIQGGSGTLRDIFRYLVQGKVMTIHGRFVVDSFSRSGSNPGVIIKLPTGNTLARAVQAFGGYSADGNGLRIGENVVISGVSGGSTLTVYTSESYTNVASGRFALVIPPIDILLN